MRGSEEMALVLYRAWLRYENAECDPDEVEWDEIGEFQQRGYLDQVNVILKHLFEHGRISAYISYDMLEALREEYRLYLLAKSEVKS